MLCNDFNKNNKLIIRLNTKLVLISFFHLFTIKLKLNFIKTHTIV